jgi:hypothetical protein
MAAPVEQGSLPELQWDIPRILRSPFQFEGAWAISVPLTAGANPANWVLWYVSVYAYVFRLTFSTDAAIAWGLYQITVDPALAAATAAPIGSTFSGPIAKPEAAVAAIPAHSTQVDGGTAAAGSYVNVLGPAWYRIALNRGILLSTAAVAANCVCTIWWTEYTT